jgi:hypothetical protein
MQQMAKISETFISEPKQEALNNPYGMRYILHP